MPVRERSLVEKVGIAVGGAPLAGFVTLKACAPSDALPIMATAPAISTSINDLILIAFIAPRSSILLFSLLFLLSDSQCITTSTLVSPKTAFDCQHREEAGTRRTSRAHRETNSPPDVSMAYGGSHFTVRYNTA